LFAFGETYADIGETYALSRERVRQLVSNALHKLRNFLMR
jgi:DNA-directed RNA polymerase sigma subunit (sigma70/sigma32)